MQITVVDPGVDRLVDRVRREARRDEDHRRVRARLVDGVGDGVEDRDALDVLAALARRHAGDDLRAVAAVAQPVERALAAGQPLDDELRVAVDDDRHYLHPLQRHAVERDPAVLGAVGDELARPAPRPRRCSRPARATARSRRAAAAKRTSSMPSPASANSCRHSSTGRQRTCDGSRSCSASSSASPPNVLSTTITVRDATRAISRTAARTSAKWCAREPRDHEVEAPVLERQLLRAARRRPAPSPAPGRPSSTVEPGLAQPPRDVPAARRDVERRLRGRRPLDDQIEVRPLAMRGALAVGLGALGPDVGHFASSTARFAASSIVGSTWRFGGAASVSSLPPLLRVRAVEPDDDRVVDRHLRERLQDPARDLVGARDPAEDVEQDRLDLRVAGDDLQRVDDALRVAAAAEVAEVRRLPAGQRDDVERRHREPGAVRRGSRPTPSSFT